MSRTVALLITLLALSSDSAADAGMRNVILIIGDGFDDQHVTMGRNYLAGMSGKLKGRRPALQSISAGRNGQRRPAHPATLPTQPIRPPRWPQARSPAWGVLRLTSTTVTSTTIGERAIAAGFKVGLVTTSSLTDATPASFLTHVSARSCEGPEEVLGSTYYGIPQPACLADARDNDGPGSIIEQLVSSGASILLGGGRKFIEQTTIDNETVAAMAARYGFRVVTSGEELTSAELGATAHRRV